MASPLRPPRRPIGGGSRDLGALVNDLPDFGGGMCEPGSGAADPLDQARWRRGRPAPPARFARSFERRAILLAVESKFPLAGVRVRPVARVAVLRQDRPDVSIIVNRPRRVGCRPRQHHHDGQAADPPEDSSIGHRSQVSRPLKDSRRRGHHRDNRRDGVGALEDLPIAKVVRPASRKPGSIRRKCRQNHIFCPSSAGNELAGCSDEWFIRQVPDTSDGRNPRLPARPVTSSKSAAGRVTEGLEELVRCGLRGGIIAQRVRGIHQDRGVELR